MCVYKGRNLSIADHTDFMWGTRIKKAQFPETQFLEVTKDSLGYVNYSKR